MCPTLQNAYTSTDETVFQLVVPSDKPELLEETIAVLAEFAFGIRYKSRWVRDGEGSYGGLCA